MMDHEKLLSFDARLNKARDVVARGICTVNDAANYWALDKAEYETLYDVCWKAYVQLQHGQQSGMHVYLVDLLDEGGTFQNMAFGHSYAEVSSQYEAVEQYDILNVHEVTGVCHDMVNTLPDEWTAEQHKLAVLFLRAMNNFLF